MPGDLTSAGWHAIRDLVRHVSPRRIVPAETYLITRRCSQRTFRLRPSTETNEIFLYCLAFAADKTGVLVHAVCVMSNHHHLVVTDPRGALPDFLRELHRLCAKAMNALQGQWENLWAAEPCNVVRLVTEGDVEEKIGYVVANPVAAGLVRQPEEWPGIVLWGNRSLRVARPTSYFREDGTCARELTLSVTAPPSRETEPGATNDWNARITRAISTKVAAAHQALASKGRSFLGRAGVLATSFIRHARSYEGRFGVIPTFAANVSEVRERLRYTELHFRQNYRAALAKWRAGRRDVPFPFGTWAFVVFHAALVEAPPLG